MPVKKSERVQEIPLSELHPFKNHPFRVVDDEAMQRTVESVAQFGVLAPALARPRPEGGYELVAGHRRMRASELAGLETMPVIVRQMDDDTATIAMELKISTSSARKRNSQQNASTNWMKKSRWQKNVWWRLLP